MDNSRRSDNRRRVSSQVRVSGPPARCPEFPRGSPSQPKQPRTRVPCAVILLLVALVVVLAFYVALNFIAPHLRTHGVSFVTLSPDLKLDLNATRQHQGGIQHAVNAKIDSIVDWTRAAYRSNRFFCKNWSSYATKRASLSISNSNFEQQVSDELSGWKVVSGVPSVVADDASNRFLAFPNPRLVNSSSSLPSSSSSNRDKKSSLVSVIQQVIPVAVPLQSLFSDVAASNVRGDGLPPATTAIQVTARMKRPTLESVQKNPCDDSMQHCDRSYNDLIRLSVFFSRHDDESLAMENVLPTSLHSVSAGDDDNWNEYSVHSLVPVGTRSLIIRISVIHRSVVAVSPEQSCGVDDVTARFVRVDAHSPDYAGNGDELDVSILHEPILRQSGRIGPHRRNMVVMWVTDRNLVDHRVQWLRGSDLVKNSRSFGINYSVKNEELLLRASSEFDSLNPPPHSSRDVRPSPSTTTPPPLSSSFTSTHSSSPTTTTAITTVETIQVHACMFLHKAIIHFEDKDDEKHHTDDIIFYRVQSGLVHSDTSFFLTSSGHNIKDTEGDEPVRVAIFSDNQYGAEVYRHLLEHAIHPPVLARILLHRSKDDPTVPHAMDPPTLAIINVGDFVDHGWDPFEWETYFWEPLTALPHKAAQHIPLVLCAGNHDGEHSVAHAFFDMPSWKQKRDDPVLVTEATSMSSSRAASTHRASESQVPLLPGHVRMPGMGGASPGEEFFAFSLNRARFIVLNTNAHPSINPHQTRWLKRELAHSRTRGASFRIVLLHIPPYTELWDEDEGFRGEPFVRRDWVPLFEKYGVDLVISGHTHAYLRGERNGVIYTIVGGGGGHLDRDKVADWDMFSKVHFSYFYVTLVLRKGSLKWTVRDIADRVLDVVDLERKTVVTPRKKREERKK
eukprot:TRINITY_DN12971_c0_g1_i1.p1 TRINITY_DN12971_c0_g1~~TRINITY_DN12971_c0_g1_i1.p1  ORF type:complete len:900 (+),score=154.49 TRINITY_DN12971_c0_g1_i1:102-2801(+)